MSNIDTAENDGSRTENVVEKNPRRNAKSGWSDTSSTVKFDFNSIKGGKKINLTNLKRNSKSLSTSRLQNELKYFINSQILYFLLSFNLNVYTFSIDRRIYESFSKIARMLSGSERSIWTKKGNESMFKRKSMIIMIITILKLIKYVHYLEGFHLSNLEILSH